MTDIVSDSIAIIRCSTGLCFLGLFYVLYTADRSDISQAYHKSWSSGSINMMSSYALHVTLLMLSLVCLKHALSLVKCRHGCRKINLSNSIWVRYCETVCNTIHAKLCNFYEMLLRFPYRVLYKIHLQTCTHMCIHS